MPDRREVLMLLAVGTVAAGLGVALGPRLADRLGSADREVLRAARFTDLSGKPRILDEWQGRILVLNFWATWCPPCREEIPALVRARDNLLAKGVEFIGIAIDQEAKVTEFVKSVRITYPVLLADVAGLDLMRKLGNSAGGLPFTVVLDRAGDIAHRHLGVVTQESIEAQLRAMLPFEG